MSDVPALIMFEEKSFDAEGFDSTWQSEIESKNESSQTTEFGVSDQETNTTESCSIQTQTETTKDTEPVDMDKLSKWLKSVCPDMMTELQDMSISNAMANLNTSDDLLDVSATMLQEFSLSLEAGDGNSFVTALSWNSTGNTLAVSSSYSHETWCHHQGLVKLYTFDRDNKLPSIPNKKFVCGACVTSLSFHPTLPSILAAGTLSGEICLWNTQPDKGDGLIASYTSHEDSITEISWITNLDTKKQTAVLASSGVDSYLILWDVDIAADSILKIRQRYTIGKYSKVMTSPDMFSNKTSKGIVCFDFSPFTAGTFILGMEGGAVLKCSLLGAKPLPTESGKAPACDPYVSFFEKHEGEISSVRFSPHRQELFLTCASDNEIRIFHIDQNNPVQIIFMQVTLNHVDWIIHEEKLLVGCGENGSIRVFSLRNGQHIPNTLTGHNVPLTKMAINKKRIDITAVGSAKGKVQLWSVPWNNIAAQDRYNIYGQ